MVAVVTGASSGIGLYTAKHLCSKGYKVYGLNRRPIDDKDIEFICTDVRNEASVIEAIDHIIRSEGRIDILINNAGGGISGAVEFTETDDAQGLFDLNFFGAVRVTKAVIPHMRKQGSGRIVNISSVAAITPIPFQTYYSATKAAILSYSLALHNELKDFGIQVTTILPGDICTSFTSARIKSDAGDEHYGGKIKRSVSKMEKDEKSGMSPIKAGRIISRVATSRRYRAVYIVGPEYKLISLLVKILPTRFVNFLIGCLYAK